MVAVTILALPTAIMFNIYLWLQYLIVTSAKKIHYFTLAQQNGSDPIVFRKDHYL